MPPRAPRISDRYAGCIAVLLCLLASGCDFGVPMGDGCDGGSVQTSSLWVATLDGADVVKLADRGDVPIRFLPDGDILFGQTDNLQRYDATSREITPSLELEYREGWTIGPGTRQVAILRDGATEVWLGHADQEQARRVLNDTLFVNDDGHYVKTQHRSPIYVARLGGIVHGRSRYVIERNEDGSRGDVLDGTRGLYLTTVAPAPNRPPETIDVHADSAHTTRLLPEGPIGSGGREVDQRGDILAFSGNGIRTYDLEAQSSTLLHDIYGDNVTLSPDATHIAFSHDETLYWSKTRDGATLSSIPAPGLQDISFSPDGTQILFSQRWAVPRTDTTANNVVQRLNLASGETTTIIGAEQRERFDVIGPVLLGAGVTPDGRLVYAMEGTYFYQCP